MTQLKCEFCSHNTTPEKSDVIFTEICFIKSGLTTAGKETMTSTDRPNVCHVVKVLQQQQAENGTC